MNGPVVTPHAATAELLFKHRFGYRFGERACIGCEWKPVARLIEDAEHAHAAHQADMLAAAGVVMGVQEWGVRYLDGQQVRSDLSKVEAERWAALARPRMYPDVELVTRWTGTTEWVPA